jgi:hypothetical protein
MNDSKIRNVFVLSELLLALVLVAGCASSPSGGLKTALVCPQCKMVESVTWLPAGPSFSRAGVGAYGVADLGYPAGTRRRHVCPGCKGSLTSFVQGGKWKHECSICKQNAFSCPVIHPNN